MATLSAAEVIDVLGLTRLPGEGGYFVETWRSTEVLSDGSRSIGTAIYYLVTPDQFSAFHRLQFDEIYHFYLGDPVELWTLHDNDEARCHLIGADLNAGMRSQILVPAGTWQGLRPRKGGSFGLLGTTMAPGFDPEDYELGDRAVLEAAVPSQQALIRSLTREA